MADSKNVPGVGPILKLGEEKLSALLTQLLSNDSFVAALQTAISTGLKAKGTMDKSLMGILGTFNVPTLEDVGILRSKIQELEETVAGLSKLVETLEAKVPGEAHAAPKKKRAKKED